MALVLSFHASCIRNKGQTCNFSRLRCRNLKQAQGKLKVFSAQRWKLNKDSQQKERYDKRNSQNRLLNTNLKNSASPIELYQLIQKNEKIMDAINVSTSAAAAARFIKSKNLDDIEYKTMLFSTYTLLSQLILQHVQKMNPQSVANCMWSLGKVQDVLENQKKQEINLVFEKLCRRAKIISDRLNIQESSNSLWAMAKFQWEDVSLIQKIVQQAINQSNKQLKPQAISNILWAMATLKYDNIKHIQYFAELSKTYVQEMKCQEVSNLMWALQQLRYYDKELILLVENNIVSNNNIIFDSQGISNNMLAFTDFGLKKKQTIFDIIVPKFISSKFLQPQDLSNFLYALALLDCPIHFSQQVVDKLLEQYQNEKFKNFLDIQLRQIQLAQIFYNIQGQKLYFPADLQKKCQHEHQDYTRKQTLVQNSFLNVVFEVVRSCFDFTQKKSLYYNDQIEIHIALQGEQKPKVAIMTHPTQSYFVNFPEKLLGRCQHHVFVLKQLGWQVVEVSAFKWNNPKYQQQFLRDINAIFEQKTNVRYE